MLIAILVDCHRELPPHRCLHIIETAVHRSFGRVVPHRVALDAALVEMSALEPVDLIDQCGRMLSLGPLLDYVPVAHGALPGRQRGPFDAARAHELGRGHRHFQTDDAVCGGALARGLVLGRDHGRHIRGHHPLSFRIRLQQLAAHQIVQLLFGGGVDRHRIHAQRAIHQLGRSRTGQPPGHVARHLGPRRQLNLQIYGRTHSHGVQPVGRLRALGQFEAVDLLVRQGAGFDPGLHGPHLRADQ